MRFLFVTPPVQNPEGGVNVIRKMAHALQVQGMEARLLFPRVGVTSAFSEAEPVDNLYDERLPQDVAATRLGRAFAPLQQGVRRVAAPVIPGMSAPGRLDLRTDDVIVIPEFAFEGVSDLYPDNPQVLLVQGIEPMLLGCGPGALPAMERVRATLATSLACAEASRLLPVPEPLPITLSVREPASEPTGRKQRSIVYLPRKMHLAAPVAVAALTRAPELEGYRFVALERASPAEVDRTLNDALMFLSFIQCEGFSLPAAEAMRSECIVVGFTGVGAAEFLTPETGIVVEANNVAGLVDAVRRAATEYDADPGRLDRLRRRGAALVRERYTSAAFTRSVVAAFEQIASGLGRSDLR